MKPIKMKTVPAESVPGEAPGTTGTPPAETLQTVQANLARQLAASAATFGEVLGKSIKLTEAGMTMGLKLFNTGGERLLATLAAKIAPAVSAVNTAAGNSNPESKEAAPADEGPRICNSGSIVPGEKVYIPFSISNDTRDRSKHIAVKIGALCGERTGAALAPGSLKVTPEKKKVLPLDFEKFVVTGTVAPGTAPDVYAGWIEVTGDEQFKIRTYVTVGSLETAGI